MPRIEPVSRDQLEQGLSAEELRYIEDRVGEPLNVQYQLAHVPGLLGALGQLVRAVHAPGHAPADLKWLVGHVSSRSAGCTYCSAHTGYFGGKFAGVDAEKIEHVWEFETSDLFSDAERAALRIAAAAGLTPNETTDEMFEELHEYFDDRAIAELVATIALFGFMNRWNDTLQPALEAGPLQFGRDHLQRLGWYAPA
jgi:alkylhydroperoxidase family enzyme